MFISLVGGEYLRRREMSASSTTFASGFGLLGCVHNSKTEMIKNKKILTQLSIPDLSPLQVDKGKVTSVLVSTLSCKRREVIGFGLCLGLVDVFVGRPKEAYAAGDEEVKQCEFTVANSGLQFCERVVGFGPEAAKGQLIKAHYVGKLENGKVFDSSYNRGKPLTFRVGVGEVIKGWDLGIVGGDGVPPMLAGGKRTLRIPAELGYGARGAGCKGGSCIIPPDSVLLFDVEFVGKA